MRARSDDAGPDETLRQPSRLVEGVLVLLEEAGVPAETNDQVVALIEAWEWGQQGEECPADECPGHGRGGTAEPCCGRAGVYNGYASDGPLLFHCPTSCSCHD